MLSKEKIIVFFKYFWKNISNKEINFLEWKEKWELFLSKYSQIYLKKAQKYSWIFKLSPFIKEVFICNTISFWSAEKKSDIDLFIVVKNWKIWTARFFLTFFIHILWIRRYWKKINWRFCLSFWATEKWAFELEKLKIKEDPFLAIWTSTLIPLIWNKKFLEKFEKNNKKWIKNYWINFIFKKNNTQNKQLFSQKIFEKIIWFNFIEKFFKFFLEKRALKKKNKIKNNFWVIISDEVLKFHNNDKRKDILTLLK